MSLAIFCFNDRWPCCRSMWTVHQLWIFSSLFLDGRLSYVKYRSSSKRTLRSFYSMFWEVRTLLRTFWTSIILKFLDAKAKYYLAIGWKTNAMCIYCIRNPCLFIRASLDFLMCSYVLNTNSWSIMPLKIPMISTFCSLSHTYKLVQIGVFTYIFSLSTNT